MKEQGLFSLSSGLLKCIPSPKVSGGNIMNTSLIQNSLSLSYLAKPNSPSPSAKENTLSSQGTGTKDPWARTMEWGLSLEAGLDRKRRTMGEKVRTTVTEQQYK